MTSESRTISNAGVHFPPPFIYLAGVAAGWAVNTWHALPITAPHSTTRVAAAVLCVLLWLGLFLSAFAAFRRHRTTIVPNRPATAVVTEGPFRFTRNPMYVSFVALYIGLMLLVNSWWPLIFLPIVVMVLQRFVIAREERYLRAAFPAEYEAYARTVRRWL